GVVRVAAGVSRGAVRTLRRRSRGRRPCRSAKGRRRSSAGATGVARNETCNAKKKKQRRDAGPPPCREEGRIARRRATDPGSKGPRVSHARHTRLRIESQNVSDSLLLARERELDDLAELPVGLRAVDEVTARRPDRRDDERGRTVDARAVAGVLGGVDLGLVGAAVEGGLPLV